MGKDKDGQRPIIFYNAHNCFISEDCHQKTIQMAGGTRNYKRKQ